MNEELAQTELAEWLEQRTNSTVYWAESPPGEFAKFKFKGTQTRPDLLSVGDLSVVIEMKDGTDSKSVYDAMSQLHEYWRRYVFGDARVVVDGAEIDVDVFLIATQFSCHGHLFKEGREQGFRQTYEDDEYWNKGDRPQFEWARTEAIPRIQWRYAWTEAENRHQIDVGLGALLSSKLDSNPLEESQSGFSDFDQNTPSSSTPKALYYTAENGSVWNAL